MLQERIEELGSAILDYKSNNIVNVIGFMSADRLYDYIERGLDCHFSKGIYKLEPLNLGKIKNDALFIINENGNEINRYQFVVLKKDIIKFKDTNKKIRTKTYIIRKCKYTNIYNLIHRETITVDGKKEIEEENKLFSNINELKKYFFESFAHKLDLE